MTEKAHVGLSRRVADIGVKKRIHLFFLGGGLSPFFNQTKLIYIPDNNSQACAFSEAVFK